MKIDRYRVAIVMGVLCLFYISENSLHTAPQQTTDKETLIARGKEVFMEYCKACHQENGQGIPGVFPPLAGSDYLMADKKRNIQNLVYGLDGEIIVKGEKYDNIMPPVPDKYNDTDIAAALSFVYNSFGNKGPVISPAEVALVRQEGKPAWKVKAKKKKKKKKK